MTDPARVRAQMALAPIPFPTRELYEDTVAAFAAALDDAARERDDRQAEKSGLIQDLTTALANRNREAAALRERVAGLEALVERFRNGTDPCGCWQADLDAVSRRMNISTRPEGT